MESYPIPLSSEEAVRIFPTYTTDFARLTEQEHLRVEEAVLHWPGGASGFGSTASPAYDTGDLSAESERVLSRLGLAWSVVEVFKGVVEAVTPTNRFAVSEAVERAYWNEHGGVLFHPWVRSLATDLGARGEKHVVHLVDYTGWRLQAVRTPAQVRDEHIIGMLRLFGLTEHGEESAAIAAGEFLVDYLYLQRAIAEDVRIASHRRAHGESTAARLARMDAGEQTQKDRVLNYLGDPIAMARCSDECRTRENIQRLLRYARTSQVAEDGVLAPYASAMPAEPLSPGTSAEVA